MRYTQYMASGPFPLPYKTHTKILTRGGSCNEKKKKNKRLKRRDDNHTAVTYFNAFQF